MVSVNSTMLALGSQAVDFSLADPHGRSWSFGDVAGPRGTLVAFVCNHCPYVRHLATSIATFTTSWVDAGIGVVAINSNDPEKYPDDAPDKMAIQAAEWGWRFPYVSDADQSVAKAYRAACTPDFYLFDADQLLVYRGRFDDSTPRNDRPITGADLDGAVTALLDGAPIATDQLPSIGCNIKWRSGNEPEWFSLLRPR